MYFLRYFITCNNQYINTVNLTEVQYKLKFFADFFENVAHSWDPSDLKNKNNSWIFYSPPSKNGVIRTLFTLHRHVATGGCKFGLLQVNLIAVIGITIGCTLLTPDKFIKSTKSGRTQENTGIDANRSARHEVLKIIVVRFHLR